MTVQQQRRGHPQADMFATRMETLSRRSDHDTSHEAARRTFYGLSDTKQKVLQAMASLDRFSDWDINDRCTSMFGPRKESSYRHRGSDLRQAGFIRDTGQRKTQDGSARVIWEWTPEGLALLVGMGLR